ncbi:MAG: hypothetical protein [Microvirus sp.]|nr:MAG: hypothetical protein [Microvirus sp.]
MPRKVGNVLVKALTAESNKICGRIEKLELRIQELEMMRLRFEELIADAVAGDLSVDQLGLAIAEDPMA